MFKKSSNQHWLKLQSHGVLSSNIPQQLWLEPEPKPNWNKLSMPLKPSKRSLLKLKPESIRLLVPIHKQELISSLGKIMNQLDQLRNDFICLLIYQLIFLSIFKIWKNFKLGFKKIILNLDITKSKTKKINNKWERKMSRKIKWRQRMK